MRSVFASQRTGVGGGTQSAFRETIFALSSGAPPAGVAVVRVSGRAALHVAEEIAGTRLVPRRATLRRLRSSAGHEIDHGLAIAFPAPDSFTGEDCVEFHLHGGRAVVGAMLAELGRHPEMRLAEPGEFTRRAFLNGKMELSQAEGLGDLIAAETELQRQVALANVHDVQAAPYQGWRRRVIHARAMIEAELDFSDERDVPGSVALSVWRDIQALRDELTRAIELHRTAEIVREGFRVVIAGAPNAGKSSLLNHLARRDVAIVSDIAGTTRDALEVALDLGGRKVVLVDTAGLRPTTDAIEAVGVSRARDAIASAHLVLELVEPGGAAGTIDATNALRVATKTDLLDGGHTGSEIAISVQTGDGIANLLDAIERRSTAATAALTGAVPSRLRHISALEECDAWLEKALQTDRWLEVRAEDLRQAGQALSRIAGEGNVEDVLDEVFSRFCIGK